MLGFIAGRRSEAALVTLATSSPALPSAKTLSAIHFREPASGVRAKLLKTAQKEKLLPRNRLNRLVRG
jgi:hypothetical protein